jgi:hypothetical protein
VSSAFNIDSTIQGNQRRLAIQLSEASTLDASAGLKPFKSYEHSSNLLLR